MFTVKATIHGTETATITYASRTTAAGAIAAAASLLSTYESGNDADNMTTLVNVTITKEN